jgi:hypothetical protein
VICGLTIGKESYFEGCKGKMLKPMDEHSNTAGNVRVDREILDSLKRSWLIPRGTGSLSKPTTNAEIFLRTGVDQQLNKGDQNR